MRKFRCVSTRFPKDFTVGKIYVNYGKGIVGDDDFHYATLDPISDFYDTKFEEVFDKKKEEIMKFDLKKEKIAVLCDTVEKVAKVCEVLGEKMFKNFRVDNQERCYVGYNWLPSGRVDKLSYDSCNYFTNKTKNYKLITFEEFMGEKEEKVKFKVGDRVEILGGTSQEGWCTSSLMQKYIGTKGTIESKQKRFVVRMDLDNDYWWFNEEDLKLSSDNSQTFTITISDSITTLETNGKKVEIKRYYTDKHDVEFAMQEVVNKYFDEVRKEERESKLPKVGDKVKIVDNGATYDTNKSFLVENKDKINIETIIKWESGELPKKDNVYKVVFKKDNKFIVEDDDSSYIINVKGLEVIK